MEVPEGLSPEQAVALGLKLVSKPEDADEPMTPATKQRPSVPVFTAPVKREIEEANKKRPAEGPCDEEQKPEPAPKPAAAPKPSTLAATKTPEETTTCSLNC